MVVRVTRADLRWDDFFPHSLRAFDVVLVLGACYLAGVLVLRWVVGAAAWVLSKLARPVAVGTRDAITYVGAIVIALGLFALILWVDAVKRAERRKRQQLVAEAEKAKALAIAAAEAERLG